MQGKMFLSSEAEQRFLRNEDTIRSKSKETDHLFQLCNSLAGSGLSLQGPSVLEFGCANGYRLSWLKSFGCKMKGIEPNAKAEEDSLQNGVLLEHNGSLSRGDLHEDCALTAIRNISKDNTLLRIGA